MPDTKETTVQYSVAIAAYNGEEVIRQQIDSILTQTLPIDEIIICDDNSTDTTWEILQTLAKEYPIIHIFRNEHNLGFIKNFERALSLCTGEYILLSDQDDIWPNDHVQALYNALGEKSLAYGNAECIRKDGSMTGETLIEPSFQLSGDISKDFRRYLYVYAQGATMLIRKELLTKANPFPPNISHDIWLGFTAYVAGKGLAYTNRTVLYYRRWGQNVSTLAKDTKKVNKTNLRNLLLGGGSVFQKKAKIIEDFIPFAETNHASEILLKELYDAKRFSTLVGSGKKSVWAIKYFFKNHNEIFGTTTRKGMFLRFIRYFVLN
ncbi:MAG: glycosyltransferase [Lachnospiraceae bacterium]|nr:glycosyltransferase [Lachnospiraceae bacterium]